MPDEKKEEDIKIILLNKYKAERDERSSSTEEGSENIRLHSKKKLYDQAIPVEERRTREEKDVLRLSENSSVQIPKEKEEL